ncbi:MAG: extracellular solute-binding protein [Candidatus Baltobacteraceae bacterium]
MRLLAILFALLAAGMPRAGGEVSVAYAASLVRVMEGPLAQALARDTGLRFEGDGKGSKALAHLISAGLLVPDVFLCADTALLEELRKETPAKLRGYTMFGSARMVIAYSRHSRYAGAFARAGRLRKPLLPILANPAVRVGRTDPLLDPKGARTLRAIALLGKHEHAPATASAVAAKAAMFPEEDLAVRVETGELDAGFFYSTEVPGRDLKVIQLPADSNLSTLIVYGIAIVSGAAHPDAARAFVRYVVRGKGKALLEAAGVRYFAHPEIAGRP